MSDLGTLRHDGERYVLRYERRYRHPPEKVWRALVEPEELRHWFPTRIDGERRAGARLSFVFEGGEAPTLGGELRVFEPPHTLEYTWDDEVLRWELSATDEGSLLVFTTTFEARAKAPRDAAGWHLCLQGLARRLDLAQNQAPTPWVALYEAYTRTIGLGDFPTFLKAAGRHIDAVLAVPGLEGYAFEGADGARMIACRAARDGEGSEQTSPEETYLVVLEGACTLSLASHAFSLRPGVEFVVPASSPVRLRVQAGTRLLYAATAGDATQGHSR